MSEEIIMDEVEVSMYLNINDASFHPMSYFSGFPKPCGKMKGTCVYGQDSITHEWLEKPITIRLYRKSEIDAWAETHEWKGKKGFPARKGKFELDYEFRREKKS